MTICKFYLQGNCRYGNNCNYEHPRGQQSYHNQQNRQDYRQLQQNQSQSQFRYQPQSQQQKYSHSKSPEREVDSNITGREFLNQIRNDFSEWINSSAWKLSSYSYTKMAPCLQNISPEEVRFSLYEAKKKNNYTQACNDYTAKLNQTVNTIKQMINPDKNITDYLLKYYHESDDIIKNKQAIEDASKKQENPFMKIVQLKQEQQTSSFFNQVRTQQPVEQQSSINPFSLNQPIQKPLDKPQTAFGSFGQQQQQTSINAFSLNQQIQKPLDQPQTAFGSFSQQQQSSTQPQGEKFNLFAQIAQNQPRSQIPVPLSGFNQKIQQQEQKFPLFNLATQKTEQAKPITNETNFFSQVVNLNPPQKENTFFGKQLPLAKEESKANDLYYTAIGNLSKQDIDEFKADHFTLGRIPNVAPAKEFC